MRFIRPIVTLASALSLGALAACSSAPPSDESQSRSEESAMMMPAPCWMNSNNLCSVSQLPMPAPDSLGMDLMFYFGCQRPKLYAYNFHADIEQFTICPQSDRLESWLIEWNSTHRPVSPLGYAHEVPNVCDACLSPAPAGDIYVFWGYIHDGPICQGMNCGSPY